MKKSILNYLHKANERYSFVTVYMQPLRGSLIIVPSLPKLLLQARYRSPSGGSLGYYTMKPLRGICPIRYPLDKTPTPKDLRTEVRFVIAPQSEG